MKRLLFCLICSLLWLTSPGFAKDLQWDAKQSSDTQKIGGRWMMRNHFNEVTMDEDFNGKFRLIIFGYTFCPDICPTALSNVSQAMDELEGMEEQFQPLFITVDPERDTPHVLREYVRSFHPSIIGLTGTPELVKRTADLFKVKYSKVPATKETEQHYLIDHSVGIYLMSETGIFITKFAHGVSGKDIAARIKEILESVK
jgi:cytochrome oxidase Cu insertion factor (SCO1/SenC/PrrC family)